jgi:hypothetical protein
MRQSEPDPRLWVVLGSRTRMFDGDPQDHMFAARSLGLNVEATLNKLVVCFYACAGEVSGAGCR